MADVFGCDTAFEKTVTHFKSSRHIRKTDGEIGLAVMGEVELSLHLAKAMFMPRSCKYRSNAGWVSSPTSKCWKLGSDACWRKEKDMGRMCGACSAILPSREWHMVGCVQYPCKCDDVTTSSQSIIEPQVAVGVHLERGFRFLTERGFIPQAVSLLLYGRITQTLQIVRNFDLFCFLDVHDIISMDLMMTVKTLI